MGLMRIVLVGGKYILHYTSPRFAARYLCNFERHFHETSGRYLPRSTYKNTLKDDSRKLEDDFPVGNEESMEHDSDIFGIESDKGVICFDETAPADLEKFRSLVHRQQEHAEVLCATTFGVIRRDIDNPPRPLGTFGSGTFNSRTHIKNKQDVKGNIKEKSSKLSQLTTEREAFHLYSEPIDKCNETDAFQTNANNFQNEMYTTLSNKVQQASVLELNKRIKTNHPTKHNVKAQYSNNQFNENIKQIVSKTTAESLSADSIKKQALDDLSQNDVKQPSYIDECYFGNLMDNLTSKFDTSSDVKQDISTINKTYDTEKTFIDRTAKDLKDHASHPAFNNTSPDIRQELIASVSHVDECYFNDNINPKFDTSSDIQQDLSTINKTYDTEKTFIERTKDLKDHVSHPTCNNTSPAIRQELTEGVSYVDECYFTDQYNAEKIDDPNAGTVPMVSNQQNAAATTPPRKNQKTIEKTDLRESKISFPDDQVKSTLLADQNYSASSVDIGDNDHFIDEQYFGNKYSNKKSDFRSDAFKYDKSRISKFKIIQKYDSDNKRENDVTEHKISLQRKDRLNDVPTKVNANETSVWEELETSKAKEHSVIKDEKDVDKKDEGDIKSAIDYVVKLKKDTQIRRSVIKDGDLIDMTGEKLDSKGFRILKNQVPDLSKLTREELLIILKNRVLFENDDVVVLNKPYNMVVHEGKTNKDPDLASLLDDFARMLDRKIPNPTLITVHRLDKETTGCILLARNEITAQHLKSLFAQRKIIKTYWVVTIRVPDPLEGIIDIPIAEGHVGDKMRMVLNPDIPSDMNYKTHAKQGKRAVTHYKVISASGNAALVEVNPETGLKHQIRVHFGFGLGCPILGDHKYSHLDKLAPQKLQSDMLQRLSVRQSKVRHIPIHIHARGIVVPEMLSGRNLYAHAPLPSHMAKNLESLKFRKR